MCSFMLVVAELIILSFSVCALRRRGLVKFVFIYIFCLVIFCTDIDVFLCGRESSDELW